MWTRILIYAAAGTKARWYPRTPVYSRSHTSLDAPIQNVKQNKTHFEIIYSLYILENARPNCHVSSTYLSAFRFSIRLSS